MADTASGYDELAEIARTWGFGEIWSSENGWHYSFGEKDSRFPLWLSAHVDEKNECFLYGRVRTYGLAGCRTDLHDWIGALWAITCRVLDVSSVWIVDEGGFALDEEIYGRLIFFSQPLGSRYSLESDKPQIERLFEASHLAAHIISHVWYASGISTNDDFSYDLEDLPPRLVSAFPRSSRGTAVHGRRSDRINYYRDSSRDISFTDFAKCSAWQYIWLFFSSRVVTDSKAGFVVGESVDAYVVRSGRIRNAISKRAQEGIRRLVGRVAQDCERRLCLVPCDSHLIVITPTGLCSKRIESGAASYAKAVEQLRRQHARNSAFLNQDIQFNWAQHPKPSRFEEFVRDILGEMPEVCRVKQSGHCNEPDGGRDLIADVYGSFLRNVSAASKQSDDSASQPVRLVIQCKTGMRNIGKGAVSDIRDTLDYERAFGFLLVVFPGITRPLLDYIETMRARNRFWIECWTKPELEAQLRTNPGIALRYRDVVELVEPKEA